MIQTIGYAQCPVNLYETVWNDFPIICTIDHKARQISESCYANVTLDSTKQIILQLNKKAISHTIKVKLYKVTALTKYEFILLYVKIANPISANINQEYVYRIKGFKQYDGHHFLGGLLPALCDKKSIDNVLNEIFAEQKFLSKTEIESMKKGLKKEKAMFSSNYADYLMHYPRSTWPMGLYRPKQFTNKPQLSHYPLYSY